LRKIGLALAMVAAGCGLSSAAKAEVLPVSGVYPARAEGAAVLRLLQVAPIAGSAGAMLGFRIEDNLRAASLNGRPYFSLLAQGAHPMPDATLQGVAEIFVHAEPYAELHEVCVRDGKGVCTDKKTKVEVHCRKRRIELLPQLRLIDRRGAVLWGNDTRETLEDASCEDDKRRPRSEADVVSDLVGRVARRPVADFVPVSRTDSFRINENRKGLPEVDAERFKEAVALTRTDPAAACQVFDAIGAANPGHIASVFNMGLCAEFRGDAAKAASAYRLSLQIDPKNTGGRSGLGALFSTDASSTSAADGLNRLAQREAAARQLAAHGPLL